VWASAAREARSSFSNLILCVETTSVNVMDRLLESCGTCLGRQNQLARSRKLA
jgi:hypothetical protein